MLATLSACASPKGEKVQIDFLSDGETTREDVYVHLGTPIGRYENDHIFTYRLGEDAAGYYVVRRATWAGIRYSLVLAFDEHDVLRRHALVAVK